MSVRRFPVLRSWDDTDRAHYTIPWEAAEAAYQHYGYGQSLERIADRGGFSRGELRALWSGNYAAATRQLGAPHWTAEEIAKYDIRPAERERGR